MLHLYLRKSGWWQQRLVRDSRRARRLYLESLEANPIAPYTYVLLLATYMPMPCWETMARCKQLVVRLLRLGPPPYFSERVYHLASAAKLRRNTPRDS